MAYRFASANTDWLFAASASPLCNSYPLTMMGWFEPDDVTNAHILFSLGDKDVCNRSVNLWAHGGLACDPVGVFHHIYAGTQTDQIHATTAFVANQWQHMAGISLAPNCGAGFIDGGSKGTTDIGGCDTCCMSNHDQITIGAIKDPVPSTGTDGDLSYIAIYTTTGGVSDANIAQIAAGRHPRNVDACNLALLWTFQSCGDLTDEIGCITLSASCPAPTWVANPVFIWTGTNNCFCDGAAGATIEGTGFNDTKGCGKLELANCCCYGAACKVTQTTTVWTDDELTFTVGLGGLTAGTLYLFATNNGCERSAAHEVTVNAAANTRRYSSTLTGIG